MGVRPQAMITDRDRNILIPSLAEVIAALGKVRAPYTYGPRYLEVKIDDTEDDNRLREVGETFNAVLNCPTVELQAFRFIKNGREFETWRTIRMPQFHL